MTCGILCVMRREGRGVLHLDNYSPLKAICLGGGGGGGGEKKKNKRKKKDNGKEREPAVLYLTNRGVAAVNGSALREVGVLSYSG